MIKQFINQIMILKQKMNYPSRERQIRNLLNNCHLDSKNNHH